MNTNSDQTPINLSCFNDVNEMIQCQKFCDLTVKLKSGREFPLHHFVMLKYTNIFYDNFTEAQKIISRYNDAIVIKLFICCYKNIIYNDEKYEDDYIINLIQIQSLALDLEMTHIVNFVGKKCSKKQLDYEVCLSAIEEIFDIEIFDLELVLYDQLLKIWNKCQIPIIIDYFASPNIEDILIFTSEQKSCREFILSKIKIIEIKKKIENSTKNINLSISDDDMGMAVKLNIENDNGYSEWNITIGKKNIIDIIDKHNGNKTKYKLGNIIYYLASIIIEHDKQKLRSICKEKSEMFEYFLMFDIDGFLNDYVDSVADKYNLSRDIIISMIMGKDLKLW